MSFVGVYILHPHDVASKLKPIYEVNSLGISVFRNSRVSCGVNVEFGNESSWITVWHRCPKKRFLLFLVVSTLSLANFVMITCKNGRSYISFLLDTLSIINSIDFRVAALNSYSSLKNRKTQQLRKLYRWPCVMRVDKEPFSLGSGKKVLTIQSCSIPDNV